MRRRWAIPEFLDEVRNNRIKSAVIPEGLSGGEIIATTTDDRKITNASVLDRGLVGDLIEHKVKFDVKPREGFPLDDVAGQLGPMLLLIGVWIYFMRQMQKRWQGGAFSFGKAKPACWTRTPTRSRFADVAGCDEAKEEVKEVVDFLKDPKIPKVGWSYSRGLLLVGPPGTW